MKSGRPSGRIQDRGHWRSSLWGSRGNNITDGNPGEAPGNFSCEVFGRFTDTVVQEKSAGASPGFPMFAHVSSASRDTRRVFPMFAHVSSASRDTRRVFPMFVHVSSASRDTRRVFPVFASKVVCACAFGALRDLHFLSFICGRSRE